MNNKLPWYKAVANLWRMASGSGIRNDMGGMSMSDFNAWVNGQTDPNAVTAQTAMNISTVYACVSLIGGAVASLPLNFYKRDPATGDREKIITPEWWLLNEEMSPAWPAAPGWEFLLTSLLLQGDAFMRIHRASPFSPKIVSFEPLDPRTVIVRRINGRLVYRVTQQPADAYTGGTVVAPVVIDQDDVLHVPGPGFNGLRGLSQINSVLGQSGHTALSADNFAASFFDNSARPDFVIETTGKLTKEQIDTLRTQWDTQYNGTAKSWRPAILQGDMKIKELTMTSTDSQLMETRAFQVEDICRIFGVPPFMVGHSEKTTSWGSGVEQMAIGFVTYALQRHLVKIEQEVNRKLFRTQARFCEFNVAGLERADTSARFAAYRTALGQAGEQPWMTYNEIRRLENLLPLTGADELKPNIAVAPAAPDKKTAKDPSKETTK